jgi:SAM-dependent methyltransferase
MQNCKQTDITPKRITQMLFGFAPTLILETAVHHGLFDALDKKPKTLEQVGKETNTSVRGLRAVMNALVGLEFLTRDGEGKYALTPESQAFLVRGKPGYAGGLFRHISAHFLPPWMQLPEAVRTGQHVHAGNQQQIRSEHFQKFGEDLFPVLYPAAQALGEALGLSEAAQPVRVLDLGTGSGVWGIGLARKSPQVRVTAVDLPGVLSLTRRMAACLALDDRFDYRAGDVLEADLGSGYDIATLGHSLHAEGEARSRVLLQRTFAALKPGGTIAIAEWLVNEERTQPLGALIFAVHMLVNTEQGDTFSSWEISGWLQEAGFEQIRMLPGPGLSPLILATRPDPACDPDARIDAGIGKVLQQASGQGNVANTASLSIPAQMSALWVRPGLTPIGEIENV